MVYKNKATDKICYNVFDKGVNSLFYEKCFDHRETHFH